MNDSSNFLGANEVGSLPSTASQIRGSSPNQAQTSLPFFAGEVDQKSIVLVDPENCSPFFGAPRAGIKYLDARDGDLAKDVLAHGVLEPIIIWQHDGTDLVISGNRRRAVVIHLRQMGHDIKLPARRLDLDPLTAAATAQACNTGRERPTAMQQAQSLAWVIKSLEQNQATVAQSFGMSEAKVSRLLTLAALPEWLLACATDPDTLSENFAGKLQKALSDPDELKIMRKHAHKLTTNNNTLSGAALAHYLLTGSAKTEAEEIYCGELCAPVGHIIRDHRGAITLKIDHAYLREGGDVSVIARTIVAALRKAMAF